MDRVGIPLDRQGVPYTGVYPSYGPGEPVAAAADAFVIGHGLFSLLDAFPFQHPGRPDLSVSVPMSERLFGQGKLVLAAGTVAITFLILVFSEVTPKVVGAAYADRLAPATAIARKVCSRRGGDAFIGAGHRRKRDERCQTAAAIAGCRAPRDLVAQVRQAPRRTTCTSLSGASGLVRSSASRIARTKGWPASRSSRNVSPMAFPNRRFSPTVA